jgi:O-acetylhomoserine (thiol)-lyase
VVIHSLTKWLGGHGTGIGGIVVDSGKFDWTDPKFRLFNEPDESYHGLRYAHDLGDLNPLAFITRMRLVPLRNLGACISPDNAWMFLQGIETLPLRMQRHCDNAMAAAKYLADHPAVKWVRYPGLKQDPTYETASRQFENGFGGMVVFGVKGGRKAIWPMWAMQKAWPSTLRAPPIRNFQRISNKQAESHPISSGYPWA